MHHTSGYDSTFSWFDSDGILHKSGYGDRLADPIAISAGNHVVFYWELPTSQLTAGQPPYRYPLMDFAKPAKNTLWFKGNGGTYYSVPARLQVNYVNISWGSAVIGQASQAPHADASCVCDFAVFGADDTAFYNNKKVYWSSTGMDMYVLSSQTIAFAALPSAPSNHVSYGLGDVCIDGSGYKRNHLYFEVDVSGASNDLHAGRWRIAVEGIII